MKYNRLGFHLSVFDVDLVSHKYNRNIFANTNKIPVPVGNILVRHPGCDIEHHDGTLSLDVVPITEAAKFFLVLPCPIR